MYFLVDYENVKNQGMQGAEFLQKEDALTVFYSEAACKMESKFLEQVEGSGCDFQSCKLLKVGKNALDFYIATRLGAAFGQGYKGDAAIVSRDNGFLAVKEYWERASLEKHHVILAPSLECAMMQSTEKSVRTDHVKKQKLSKSIEAFTEAYQEKQKLRIALRKAFKETDFEDCLDEIVEIAESGESLNTIYRNSLRRFGRDSGLDIYRKMKKDAGLIKFIR